MPKLDVFVPPQPWPAFSKSMSWVNRVLMLHGFPESRHSWRAALPMLAAHGYRAVAPDQRGYSSGARPDPADQDPAGHDDQAMLGAEPADA